MLLLLLTSNNVTLLSAPTNHIYEATSAHRGEKGQNYDSSQRKKAKPRAKLDQAFFAIIEL